MSIKWIHFGRKLLQIYNYFLPCSVQFSLRICAHAILKMCNYNNFSSVSSSEYIPIIVLSLLLIQVLVFRQVLLWLTFLASIAYILKYTLIVKRPFLTISAFYRSLPVLCSYQSTQTCSYSTYAASFFGCDL